MTPLTKKQKAEIAQLAAVAWARQAAVRAELAAANPELGASALAEGWRRVEQERACGVQSLRACTQAHFAPLMAHFARLAGLAEVAAHWERRMLTDGARRARWRLEQECTRAGVDLAYAARIFWCQARRPLSEASEKELWRLIYTVRNRAAARRCGMTKDQ